MKRRAFLAAAVVGAIAAPGAVKGYSVEVTVVEAALRQRIVFLSDLHVHLREPRGLVELVSGLNPSLILLGGDIWDELSPDPPWAALRLVEELSSLAPLAAVLGNHEHWAARSGHGPPLREAVRLLEERGAHVLRDEAIRLGGIDICGIDWRDDVAAYAAPLARLHRKGCSVVLAHSPDVFHYSDPGYDAFYLAGHTHGGQVCLPGAVTLKTNSVHGYKWGLYRRGSARLYVSRGLGEMLPPRLFCPRQLVVIK